MKIFVFLFALPFFPFIVLYAVVSTIKMKLTSTDKLLRRHQQISDGYIHTNTIEGFFGLFKRGMKGIYQHCKTNHLFRYLCEFDFRYNHRGLNDKSIATEIIANALGKRLKYRNSLVA
jgi:hypothetical protein